MSSTVTPGQPTPIGRSLGDTSIRPGDATPPRESPSPLQLLPLHLRSGRRRKQPSRSPSRPSSPRAGGHRDGLGSTSTSWTPGR